MAELTRARRLLGKGGSRRAVSLGEPPKNRGGGLIGAVLLSLAVVFDVAKAFFATFIITGSLLAGAAAAMALDSNGLTSWLPGFVKTGVGVAVTVGTATLTGPALESFGVVVAMLIGFAGWLILIFIMIASGIRFLTGHPRTFLKLLTGFVASEIPVLDAIPTFTPAIWLILKDEKKRYQTELKAYEERAAELQRDAGEERAERVMLLRQAQENQNRQTEEDAGNYVDKT